LGAWLEVERFFFQLHEVNSAWIKVIGNSRTVRQEVIDRDLLPGLGTRRKIGTDGIMNMQFAPFLEHEDSHGGKFFRYRSDAKHRGWSVRKGQINVSHIVSLTQEHLSTAGDQHSSSELMCFDQRQKICIHLRGERGMWLGLNCLRIGGTCTQQKDQAEKRHCPCEYPL
jgi:hypothetical protein